MKKGQIVKLVNKEGLYVYGGEKESGSPITLPCVLHKFFNIIDIKEGKVKDNNVVYYNGISIEAKCQGIEDPMTFAIPTTDESGNSVIEFDIEE